jgi:hypothetical protein
MPHGCRGMLVHSPVLVRRIPGPGMREVFEPHELRPVDLPGHLEGFRLRSQYICSTTDEHDTLVDTGELVPGPTQLEVCLGENSSK